MRVEIWLFISFGEIIKQGRVFLISRPWVGSRLIKIVSGRKRCYALQLTYGALNQALE